MDYLTIDREQPALANIIEAAKTDGRARDPAWLARHAAAGRLGEINKDFAGEFERQMASMAKVLDGVFPDRWDIAIEPRFHKGGLRGLKIALAVHWPEIEVVNEKGMKHLMRDLFAVLPITQYGSFAIIPEVLVARATLSRAESDSGYAHSHARPLNSYMDKSAMPLRSFCYGKGTDLHHQLVELMRAYHPTTFEMLLWLIDSALRWESEEGTPYLRIADIAEDGSRPFEGGFNYWHCIQSAASHLYFEGLEYYASGGRYAIRDNDAFARALLDAVLADGSPEVARQVLAQRAGNSYYALSGGAMDKEGQDEDGEKPWNSYVHRGRRFTFRCEKPKKEKENKTVTVHPSFVSYAKREIEKQIHYLAVRKAALAGR